MRVCSLAARVIIAKTFSVLSVIIRRFLSARQLRTAVRFISLPPSSLPPQYVRSFIRPTLSLLLHPTRAAIYICILYILYIYVYTHTYILFFAIFFFFLSSFLTFSRSPRARAPRCERKSGLTLLFHSNPHSLRSVFVHSRPRAAPTSHIRAEFSNYTRQITRIKFSCNSPPPPRPPINLHIAVLRTGVCACESAHAHDVRVTLTRVRVHRRYELKHISLRATRTRGRVME